MAPVAGVEKDECELVGYFVTGKMNHFPAFHVI